MIASFRCFAARFGWRGLQLDWIRSYLNQSKELVPVNVAGGVVISYTTTDPKFFLQINTVPHGQLHSHQATITAERYGIGNIGWHPFTLHEDDDKLLAEIEMLRPWLDRNQYKNRKWLRHFKSEHPDMLMPTCKKRRGR